LLSKFKKEVIKMCGLQDKELGKPGLQETNSKLWVDAKNQETEAEELFVSLSIDGKRIAMRKDGIEDMGGLGSTLSRNQVNQNEKEEKRKILDLLRSEDRRSLCSVYDTLTVMAGEVSRQMTGINKLIDKNTKQAIKNPLLNKYLYILKEKLGAGKQISSGIENVQVTLIEEMAQKRKALSLLPNELGEVNLAMQPNWNPLKLLAVEEDTRNVCYISNIVKRYDNSACFNKGLCAVLQDLSRTFKQGPRCSETFKILYRSCYLSTRDMYKACGLRANRPVQDMKDIFLKSRSSVEEFPEEISPIVTASIAAFLSPMYFGQNCMLFEVGIKADQGIASTPDLLVLENEGKLLYTVMMKEKIEGDIFECSQESLATCVMDAFLYKSFNGSILIQYSDSSFVAFSVPRIDSIASQMIQLCDSYLNLPKCFVKRSKENIENIEKIRLELREFSDTVSIMGSYPLVKKVLNNKVPGCPERVILKQSFQQISSQVGSIIEDKNKFLAKQARELLAVNVSDISGNPSKHPHTMLAATFLSNLSLKVVGEECLNEVSTMMEKLGASVINIAVDGELLALATNCNGQPGTTLALAKFLMKRLMTFSKDNLVGMISRNAYVNLSSKNNNLEEIEEIDLLFEEDTGSEQEIEEQIEDSIALMQSNTSSVKFNPESVEKYFDDGTECQDQIRLDRCSKLKVSELRAIGLRHIFPKVKKDWLIDMIGTESITIIFTDGSKLEYQPNNVFRKSDSGLVTISFDMAHLSNLCRESAAKGKLDCMGLSVESLKSLSEKQGYEYLKKIIAIKNNQLQFDSMNQHASAILFSDQTVAGLKAIKDFKGANCVEKLSNGLIKALDLTGISSQIRIKYLVALKHFIEDKNSLLDRLKRPDSKNITNELYQMILCSIDSHVFTYLNIEFFNPRRKSTASVEQFFGQMTLLADHGTKLDSRQVADILSRVMLINALRMLPFPQKGFLFLTKLKVHMKSYRALLEEDNTHADEPSKYPKRVETVGNLIFPLDSYFDKISSKTKRKLPTSFPERTKTGEDGHYRKYHRKFK
jgi:hypothetical protein